MRVGIGEFSFLRAKDGSQLIYSASVAVPAQVGAKSLNPDTDRQIQILLTLPMKTKEEKTVIKPSLNNILWLISAAALGKYVKGYKIKTRLDMCLVKIHKACLATLFLMWNIVDLALLAQILP